MSLEGKIIAFIGAGAMGSSMINGLLSKQLVMPEQIIASDPSESIGKALVEQFGLTHTIDNAEAVSNADVVVLAIKPQVMGKVLPGLNGKIAQDTLVVSIAAGTKLKTLIDGCGAKQVVRAMPNTPGQIGAGMTVWTATPDVNDEQQEIVGVLLGALGETLQVHDEKYIDMATAINGSGPGYVFLLLEAMVDAGVHLGFARADAEKLVYQTMLGSVKYAVESGEHPAVLRNQVTSPGGTTAAGLSALEKGGIRSALSEGIWAAYRRSVELGLDD